MFDALKKLLTWGILVGGGAALIWYWGFLGEFRENGIPAAAKAKGVALPLEDVRLEVSLSRMVMVLYADGTEIKRYDLGYGREPAGRLGEERGTPLGEYRVLRLMKEGIDPMKRGSRFIVLDYPNDADLDRAFQLGVIDRPTYDQLYQAWIDGRLPPKESPVGGWLGIQGNFFAFRHRRFTDGSLALSNADLNELYEHLPLGSRVVIED